jgi:hypothetical protein
MFRSDRVRKGRERSRSKIHKVARKAAIVRNI